MTARIHDGWLRTTKPKAPAKAYTPVEADKRPGIPPMECEACHDYYVPKRAGQKYCTRPECVTRRDRATKRQQERRHLQQMMADAERKKQEYNAIGKAQITAVKRAFRETKGRTA